MCHPRACGDVDNDHAERLARRIVGGVTRVTSLSSYHGTAQSSSTLWIGTRARRNAVPSAAEILPSNCLSASTLKPLRSFSSSPTVSQLPGPLPWQRHTHKQPRRLLMQPPYPDTDIVQLAQTSNLHPKRKGYRRAQRAHTTETDLRPRGGGEKGCGVERQGVEGMRRARVRVEVKGEGLQWLKRERLQFA